MGFLKILFNFFLGEFFLNLWSLSYFRLSENCIEVAKVSKKTNRRQNLAEVASCRWKRIANWLIAKQLSFATSLENFETVGLDPWSDPLPSFQRNAESLSLGTVKHTLLEKNFCSRENNSKCFHI